MAPDRTAFAAGVTGLALAGLLFARGMGLPAPGGVRRGQPGPEELADQVHLLAETIQFPKGCVKTLAVSGYGQSRLRQDTIEAGIVPKVIPHGIQFQIAVVQTKRQLHQFA